MKNLLLIFLFLSIGCGQTPLEKDKEKGVMANILVPTANFFRTTSTPSDDATAAANHATKLAYIKSLPLYDVSAKTAAELKVLSLDGIVESAEVPTDGKPSIKFYVATKATSSLPASRLVGFGWTTKATTVPSGTTRFASNLTTVSNINFTIAKYVEGTNGSPGKWVNYIVTTPEVTAGSDGTTTYTRSRAFSLPTNDNEGTITEDKVEGSYTYKFSRNIITSKDFIKSTYGETRTTAYTKTKTLSAVSSTKQANLGDLTYNASLPHRVIVYLGTGNVRGTSTNNTNGTDTATGVTTVNFDDGETLAYDFIPETKAIKALQRDITNTETCNRCHQKASATTTTGITARGLIFHGSGGRNDVKHCVMCHTDQLRAGSDVNVIADTTTGLYSAPTPAEYYVLDGYNVVDFPVMVHKFHMSTGLTKGGNYYAIDSGYNFKTKAAAFISLADAKLCYNCHTTNKSAVNEDNWKTKPSIAACGSCHDGVNFANGLMFKSLKTSNKDVTHGGGKQTDDSKCAGCHTVSDVISKHGL